MSILKKICSVALCFATAFAVLPGCTNSADDSSPDSSNTDKPKEETPVVCPVEYEAYKPADFDEWARENYDSAGTTLLNRASTMPGIAESEYFSLEANGKEVPVYAEKTTNGVHSLAFIDLDGLSENPIFKLNLVIHTSEARTNPVVLPESSGVKAVATGKKVTATITDFGSFTFTFDRKSSYSKLTGDGSQNPLTVIVKRAEKPSFPADYQKKEFTPGRYTIDQTSFTESKTVYYFKKGTYEIEGMKIPSESEFYFEPGTVLRIKDMTFDSNGRPVVNTFFSMNTAHSKNIKFGGRVAIDCAARNGSLTVYAEDKRSDGYTGGASGVFDLSRIDGLEFYGVHVVNSPTWTCCFTSDKNVTIRDITLVAYKTFSDGVMISDSNTVNVSGCFVRTGDDAMEVKSTSDGSVTMGNIVFENNAVWTDKGIAYGSVYEDNFDRKNVTWRNNSVGFALASWSEHLGCTNVHRKGENYSAVDENLRFENIEIYQTYCPVATIVMDYGGTIKNIYYKNITARYVDIAGNRNFRGPIDIVLRNYGNKDESYFTLKALYFDNIEIAGKKLTADNKEELVTTKINGDFEFEYKIIRVNTLG